MPTGIQRTILIAKVHGWIKTTPIQRLVAKAILRGWIRLPITTTERTESET